MASGPDKPIVWLKSEVRTPPFSQKARIEAGTLLRQLQRGELLTLPHSRPLPVIGAQRHELRIPDHDQSWRIIYQLADDAVVVLGVFGKKTQTTPTTIIRTCKHRLAAYMRAALSEEEE